MADKKVKKKKKKVKASSKKIDERSVVKAPKKESVQQKKEKPAKTKEEGFLEALKRFFKGVAHEYKQVIWPSPQDVFHASLLVIIIMVVLSLYMYLVDIASSITIDFLRHLFAKL